MIKQFILLLHRGIINIPNIKGRTVLLILINFYFSCTSNEIRNKITETDSFWYIYEYDSINKIYENINYGYKFKSNGNLTYMNFDFSTHQLNKYVNIMNDVKQLQKWKYHSKNNILEIKNRNYKILSFSKDTLILEYITNSKKTALINLRKENPEILKYYKPSLTNE